MKKQREFKQEIGRIPKEWEVVTLDELVKEDKFAIVDGPFGTQLHSNEYVDSGVPLIRVNNINKDGSFNFNELVYISEIKFEKLKRSAVYPGDILLAKTGATIGKVSIFPKEFEKGLIASSCAKISINKNKAYTIYVFYFLLSEFGYKQILALSTGATRPTINLNPISKITIPLPPLPEQKKIAEILSTLDTAIEKVDEAIAKTERIKKGLMQELLTKGIGHKEFKNTEIGWIPKEWEVVKVGKIGNVITGTTPSTKVKEYWGEGYLFVTPTDFSNNKYVYKTERSVTQRGVEKARIIPKDSVMVTCIASIGEIAMSSEECITNQQINSIVCGEKANPHYVYYVMKFRKNVLKKWAGITTSPIVKKSLFEEFPLPLPPLSEQHKIVEILSTVDKRLELLRNKKEKLTRIKKGLMNDLLTGKKRVKV